MGTVKNILLRPERVKPPIFVQFAVAIENFGLEGDHYKKSNGTRQITLIEQDHLDNAAQILDTRVSALQTRRNIVVMDLRLNELPIYCKLAIGEIIIQKTGLCPPCGRMNENLGPGGQAALKDKGGITAKILKGGRFKVGDSIEIIN